LLRVIVIIGYLLKNAKLVHKPILKTKESYKIKVLEVKEIEK